MLTRRFGFGLLAVVVAASSAAACGSDVTTSSPSTTVAAGSATSVPADPDRCPAFDTSRLPPVNPPSEAARQGAMQEVLRGDIERVRQYGQTVPEEFNDTWLDYRDGQWIFVAGFKSGVEQHRTALRARVEHPDRMLVCRSTRSSADRQRILAELATILNSQLSGSYSVGIDRTSVNLRADQEQLAKELYDKYAPSIDITVGAFPYPPANVIANAKCPTLDAVAPPSGLRVTVELASTSFSSGTGPKALVRVRNQSATRYAGSQGGIYLVRQGTRTVMGVFTGARDLALRTFDVAPGGEGSFDDVFGTAPCAWEGSYTLPKGTYEVLATVNVNGIGMVVGEPTRVELT